jgi:type I restriction enzyme S subunit
VQFDKTQVDKSFFVHQVECILKRAIGEAHGATMKHLTKPAFDALPFYLPDIQKQKAIADSLDKISHLITLRKRQLSKLDELVKSRFVEMFGEPTINSKGWPVARLSELGELNRGVSKARPRNSPDLLGGPYPLVQTGEVANSGLYIRHYNATYSEKGLAQSRLWNSGTLCITIAANIAQTSILTFDACFPDSVVGFVANERTNSVFVHFWFTFFQRILESQAPQVAQKNINLKILSELNVITPPLALQQEFAAFVEKVDKLEFKAKASLEKLETLKKAMMQKYFN